MDSFTGTGATSGAIILGLCALGVGLLRLVLPYSRFQPPKWLADLLVVVSLGLIFAALALGALAFFARKPNGSSGPPQVTGTASVSAALPTMTSSPAPTARRSPNARQSATPLTSATPTPGPKETLARQAFILSADLVVLILSHQTSAYVPDPSWIERILPVPDRASEVALATLKDRYEAELKNDVIELLAQARKLRPYDINVIKLMVLVERPRTFDDFVKIEEGLAQLASRLSD